MSLILKQLFQLIKLLNSETGTNQIASGLALGFVLGVSPLLSLQSFLIFVIIFIFRVQLGAALLSAFFFKFGAYFLDGVFDSIGYAVLTLPSLKSVFTQLYNLPLVPLTRFNNTIVMGGGILGLALFPVLFFLFRFLILKYRVAVLQRFENSKFWKAVKATRFYKWYYSYDNLYGHS